MSKRCTTCISALLFVAGLLASVRLSYAQVAAAAPAPFTTDWIEGVCKHCRPALQLGELQFAGADGVWTAAFWSARGEQDGGYVVLHSPDAGTTWKQLSSTLTRTAPPSLSFADAMHGLVSGVAPVGESWILRTDDGGRHWARVSDQPLQGVIVFDPTHSYGRSDNHFLRSEDGGGHWAESEVSQLKFIDCMYFLDRQTGWMAGSDGEAAIVLRTSDGGEHWQESRVATGKNVAEVHDIYFSDAQQGWLTAWHPNEDGAQLFHTADGGRTWHVDPDTAYQGSRNWLSGVRVIAGGVAIGFGRRDADGTTDKGIILYSSDLGAHWQKFNVPRAIEGCQAVGGNLMCSALADEPGLWVLKIHPKSVAEHR